MRIKDPVALITILFIFFSQYHTLNRLLNIILHYNKINATFNLMSTLYNTVLHISITPILVHNLFIRRNHTIIMFKVKVAI